jgi:hypothetical protein
MPRPTLVQNRRRMPRFPRQSGTGRPRVSSTGGQLRVLLGQTAQGVRDSAVRVPVGALCVLDAHLDTLRQPWVAVPELTAAYRQCRGEPSARNALHALKGSTLVLTKANGALPECDRIVVCPVLTRGSHQPRLCYVRALGGVFMPNNSKRPGGHHEKVTCFEGGDPEPTP